MITDSEPSRPGRTFRVAIVLSLLVHGSGAALYGITPFSKLVMRPNVRPTPEQMVTISDSMTIAKKAVVPPRQHLGARHQPSHRRPPVPQQAVAQQPPPVPQSALLRQVVPTPQPAPPTPRPVPQRVRHELAKASPHGPHVPPKTVIAAVPERVETAAPPTAPPATPEPTFPPETARPAVHQVRLPRTVALAEPAPPAHSTRPTRAQLTPEQIAQIDSDLAKSIAHDRSEENPLRVPKTAAAAPRRYHMSVDSIHVGTLKSGEGTYWPLDDGRRAADGYTYYRCAYAFQWADGTFERGVVPWPVRFAPSEDPIVHPELESDGPIGLPPPPPGWQLSDGIHVGRALRSYFPNRVFADD